MRGFQPNPQKSTQKLQARGFDPEAMAAQQSPGPRLGFRPGAMAQEAAQPSPRLGFDPAMFAQAKARVLNQQPDSIPAMMKPGEYVLPPDTVAAMGGPGALDATVAQTHVPGNQQAVVPRGFQPKHFFANGGLLDEEQRKPGSVGLPGSALASTPAVAPAAAPTPRAQFVADQNAKLTTANAGLAERTQQMNERYRPAPNSPSSTFPGNREPGAASAAPSFGFQPSQPGAQNTQAQQPTPQAAPTETQARGLPMKPIQNAQAANAPTGQTSTHATQPAPQAAPMEQPQVRGLPGVYQHGKGQYSDNPDGMGFAPGFTGQPSAQNMQAANALAGQQQAQSLGRVAAQQAQQAAMQTRGLPPPKIAHSGNDFTAQQNLRGLKMDAEWAMQRAPRKKYAMQDPAVMAYQAALQGDTAARYGGQAALEAKTNDTNASLQREQMQQQGANHREVGQSVIARARLANEQRQQAITNDLAERRLALDDRKAETANVPSGYRTSADGRGLEAIPGGPADPATSKAALQRREDAGYVTEILDMARPLVEKSTGSGVGTAFDKAAQFFGETTEGGNAAAQLKVLQGALVSKMPRMEGPQSDRDVELYREMAARIGDSTVPRQQRQEAMNTLEMLQQKYAPAQQHQQAQGGRGGQGAQGEQQPQFRVMRTGVYNGRRVVQYEDGSLSYAD